MKLHSLCEFQDLTLGAGQSQCGRLFEHGTRHGIEVVAVNPSLLLGPGDRRLSSTGDVRKFLRRQIPVVPDGGVSFVDARDAAAATANALERGRAGERYLLGGPNWTMKEFFARLGRVANVAPPCRAPLLPAIMSFAFPSPGHQATIPLGGVMHWAARWLTPAEMR